MDTNEAAIRQTSVVTQHWIVMAHPPLLTPGRPKPYRRHETREAAEKEAARLAGKMPGREFAVYERLSVVSVVPATEKSDGN